LRCQFSLSSPRVWTFFLACPKMWFLSTACVLISKMRAGDLSGHWKEHFFFSQGCVPRSKVLKIVAKVCFLQGTFLSIWAIFGSTIHRLSLQPSKHPKGCALFFGFCVCSKLPIHTLTLPGVSVRQRQQQFEQARYYYPKAPCCNSLKSTRVWFPRHRFNNK
jgi:hypothetical protein